MRTLTRDARLLLDTRVIRPFAYGSLAVMPPGPSPKYSGEVERRFIRIERPWDATITHKIHEAGIEIRVSFPHTHFAGSPPTYSARAIEKQLVTSSG